MRICIEETALLAASYYGVTKEQGAMYGSWGSGNERAIVTFANSFLLYVKCIPLKQQLNNHFFMSTQTSAYTIEQTSDRPIGAKFGRGNCQLRGRHLERF